MLLFCYLYVIVFQMFCQKEKNFLNKIVLTKYKQKICNTKEERKKNENDSLCSFYKTIKCNNNVNDLNKNLF